MFVAVVHDLSRHRTLQAAAERAQRMHAIGHLTGGVAHDFNNILTVITGNLELLEMQMGNGAERALVEDALEASALGAKLTDHLLSFARRGALSPQLLDPGETVGHMIGLLDRTLGAQYRIVTHIDPEIWSIRTDAAQLQTAILNLAVNAQQAMVEGGVLTISIENIVIDDGYIAQEVDVETGEYARISISDTGEGMSATARRRAFEPFFSTKPEGKGTGLGLSMVYGFVRQSGGHVTLYSEQGQGTTLGLYFPRAQANPGEAVDDASTLEPIPTVLALGGGKCVLVVEDNPAVRTVTLSRLAALDYVTVEAADADEALEVLARKSDIDLVFSDIIMPGSMTGLELAHQLRASYPALKVLLTTGFAGEARPEDPATDLNGLLHGFELLQKPYRQADLAQALRRLLGDD